MNCTGSHQALDKDTLNKFTQDSRFHYILFQAIQLSSPPQEGEQRRKQVLVSPVSNFTSQHYTWNKKNILRCGHCCKKKTPKTKQANKQTRKQKHKITQGKKFETH